MARPLKRDKFKITNFQNKNCVFDHERALLQSISTFNILLSLLKLYNFVTFFSSWISFHVVLYYVGEIGDQAGHKDQYHLVGYFKKTQRTYSKFLIIQTTQEHFQLKEQKNF